MNRKGQALVEFVILLPILIFIVFATIDFGSIYYQKNRLENKLSDVKKLIQKEKTEEYIREYLNKESTSEITYEVIKENQTIVKLYTSIDIITPGLNLMLGDSYRIETEGIVE